MDYVLRPRWRQRPAARALGPGLLAVVATAAWLGTAPLVAHAQGQPYLIKDINRTGASVGADHLLVVGDTLVFAGQDEAYGWELWRSDGTAQGTARIADIRPGPQGSTPWNLVDAGGVVLFTADDGVHGVELWRSDGTEGGTEMVADVEPGPSGSYPSNLVWSPALGLLVFSAWTEDLGYELWASDGTAAGTFLLGEVEVGPGGSNPANVVDRDGTIFFTAWDATHRNEVWASDGTPGGLVRVTDLHGTGWWSAPRSLTVFDGALFFAANDGAHGAELWRCDDPSAGASLIDVAAGVAGSLPSELVVSAGALYFFAQGLHDGQELWRSDGTAAGTAAVSDFGDEEDGVELHDMIDAGGILYFVGEGRELWKSDGTPGGTVRVADINIGTCGANPEDLVAVGSRVFFEARVSGEKGELWVTDGTEPGTYRVKDIHPGPEGSAPRDMVDFGGRLFFTAIDGEHGRELWQSDGSEAGTSLVVDVLLRSEGSVVIDQTLQPVEGSVVFLALTGAAPSFELWSSDGSEAGTARVPGTESMTIWSRLTAKLGSKLVLWADDGVHGSEPWSADLDTSTAALLRDLGGPTGSSDPWELVVAGTAAFFTTAPLPSIGGELWRTDGTPAGTTLVKDIYPGGSVHRAKSSYPRFLTDVAGTLLFVADDPAHGPALWRSDGTADGTILVKDFMPGSSGSNEATGNLRALGAKVFLFADDGVHGSEPWISDGSEEGTLSLGDLRPGAEGCFGLYYESLAHGGLVYFVADDGVHGAEPWRSDGTPQGTAMLRDVWPGAGSSSPRGFTVSGGRVFFFADDQVRGLQPWRSDGTTAGTEMLREIRERDASSWATLEMADVNGTLYLSIDDADHGHELWLSDGTLEGTMLAADLVAGPQSSYPHQLTNASGRLYFSAFDPDRGRELWTLTCGDGRVDTGEGCDAGPANGTRSSCCDGACRLQTTPDVDGDAICDRGDPLEGRLALDRVIVRRQTERPAPDGSLLVVGSSERISAGDAIDPRAGIELEVRAASGVAERVTWPATECRVRAGGSMRCVSADRTARLRTWPRDGGFGLRARLSQLRLSGPFAGPVSVRLTHGGAIDRTATTDRCTGSAAGMTCRRG